MSIKELLNKCTNSDNRYQVDYVIYDKLKNVVKDKLPGGRRRRHQIRVRLNDDELKIVKGKYKESGCRSMEAFMRKSLMNLKIINIDFEPVKRNNYLLSNIANNINQMAAVANETNSVSTEDLEKLRKEVSDIWPLLKSTLSQLQSISR